LFKGFIALGKDAFNKITIVQNVVIAFCVDFGFLQGLDGRPTAGAAD
jgi:hypothetical protein